MEDNAIMQRVYMLGEAWQSEIDRFPDKRILSWVATTLVEFRTIKGFTLFQTSLERTFIDKVILYEQPFDTDDFKSYSYIILEQLKQYVQVWNKTPELIEQTEGLIKWDYEISNIEDYKLSDFITALDSLSSALNQEGERLILAIYPQNISNYKAMAMGIEELLKLGIPDSLRFMLYDNYELMMFKSLEKNYPKGFGYLEVDLDMAGAMDDILEQAKTNATEQEAKDSISFQQSLLNLNQAISIADESSIKVYTRDCLSYTVKYKWYHLQAMVYYFLHTYYSAVDKHVLAVDYINQAIEMADKACDSGVESANQLKVQYRIGKGNYYFIQKKFKEATEVYQQCIDIIEKEIKHFDPLVRIGILQMLGNALKKTEGKKQAREVFEKGWEILSSYDDEFLKENLMAKYYARDFTEVMSSEKYNFYHQEFTRLWTDKWERELKEQAKSENTKLEIL